MAEEKVLAIKAAIIGVLGGLTALWGWFGWMCVILVMLMATDWIVGSAVAAKHGEWESHKLREGAWHKGGMILIVLVAMVTDTIIRLTISNIPGITLPFDYTVLLSPLVVLWYIVGELGSLAEHAAATGANVPPWLLNILKAGKKAVDSAGEKLTDDEEGKDDDGK